MAQLTSKDFTDSSVEGDVPLGEKIKAAIVVPVHQQACAGQSGAATTPVKLLPPANQRALLESKRKA